MFPFYKLLTYTVKILSKPLVSFLTNTNRKYQNIENHKISKFFISLGQKNSKFEIFLNKKILGLKIDSEMFEKPLNPEIALEKGIEFFYQFFLYVFLILVTVHELRISTKSEVKKNFILEKKEKKIFEKFEKIFEENKNLKVELGVMEARIRGIEEEMKMKLFLKGEILNLEAGKYGLKN